MALSYAFSFFIAVKARLVYVSPNCDERPPGTLIDLLVIHNISLPPGEFGGNAIHRFFMNQLDPSEHPYFQTIIQLHVSAHLFIDRTGIVKQYVPFEKRAWHAGQSVFQGRERCNDFSIGIELEGADDVPYDERQYQSLRTMIKHIQTLYPAITSDRIVGHSDISPGRKTDPGAAFDWEKIV